MVKTTTASDDAAPVSIEKHRDTISETSVLKTRERANAWCKNPSSWTRTFELDLPSGSNERVGLHATTILEELFSLSLARVRRGTPDERACLIHLINRVSNFVARNELLASEHRRDGWNRVLQQFAATECHVLEDEELTEVFGVQVTELRMRLLDDGDFTNSQSAPSMEVARHHAFAAIRTLSETPQVIRSTLAPALSELDKRLALTWTRLSVEAVVDIVDRLVVDRTGPDTQFESPEDWDVERCFSARRAELHVSNVLRELGCAVADVSQRQLTHPGSSDWKDADILVGDSPIDVKNSRRRQNGNYAGTFVKKFKVDASRSAVRYAGVSSKFQRSLQRYNVRASASDVAFLGTSSEQELAALESDSSTRVSVEISRTLRTGVRIPTWAFALPSAVYERHRRAAESLQSLWSSLDVFDSEHLRRLAAAVRSFGIEAVCASQGHAFARDDSLFAIADSVHRRGRIPAVILQGVLDSFCTDASTGQSQRTLKTKDLLFPNATMPLCVYDPTESVRNLCGILDVLLAHADSALRRVSRIALRGEQHLTGITHDSQRITLVVFCGDCLEYPLIRGSHVECESGSGHLVCSCGWCPCKPRSSRHSVDTPA